MISVLFERLSTTPLLAEQMAFRISLSNEMLQTVEMELSFPTTIAKTSDIVLDQIRHYIRKMRSVSLDRMEFEQCRQEFNESFDNDFIRLQRIANCADLFGECLED